MAEMDAIYWTFSTLFQGLCALYGLLLVWYVYMMTGLAGQGRELCGEYRGLWGAAYYHKEPFVPTSVGVGKDGSRVVKVVGNVISYDEERVADMKEIGKYFLRVRRHEMKEKVVFLLLGVVSVLFMVVGTVLVWGLTVGEEGILLWGGAVAGLVLVWLVSGVFAGYAIGFRLVGVKETEGWRFSRSTVKNVVKRGRWFFDEGLLVHEEIDYVVRSRDDLREGSFIDVRKGHFRCIDMKPMREEWDKLKKLWYGWE